MFDYVACAEKRKDILRGLDIGRRCLSPLLLLLLLLFLFVSLIFFLFLLLLFLLFILLLFPFFLVLDILLLPNLSGDGRRVSVEYLIAAVEAPHHRLINGLLLRPRLLLLLIPIVRVRIRRIRPTGVRIVRVAAGEQDLCLPGRSTAET